jgi:hypothetical protein
MLKTATSHLPAAFDISMQVNAAPIRHDICFSAIASSHKYGNTPQSEEDVGGVGSGGTGFAAAAASPALLSLRYVEFRES